MAIYNITATGQFKKDLKLAKKRGLSIDELFKVVDDLAVDIKIMTLKRTGTHSDLFGK